MTQAAWDTAFFEIERGLRKLELVLEGENDPEQLIRTLQRLDHSRKKVADMLDQVHGKLYTACGTEKTTSTPAGTVEKYVTSTTKWDDELIVRSILSKTPTVVDPETGEVRLDGDHAVSQLRKAASISYWRRGVLKEMGIDADQVS